MPDNPTAKPSISRVQDIVELVRRLCTAMVTVEMFPSDHPQSREGSARAYEWLTAMLERYHAPIVISAAGRQILLDGMPLEDKNPLVAKLAVKFGDLHVTNLFFDPSLTLDEFQRFFRILGRGVRAINEQGGLAALLAAEGITAVRMRDISYVMVTEDQKIVNRDAKVVDGQTLPAGEVDEAIARYIAAEILKKAEDQKWLISEMKNDPSRMAKLITEGISFASSRGEAGAAQQAETIEALLENVKLVGHSLLDESTGEVKDGQEDMEQAILRLENEIRLRSSHLMSSKVATGFINEVLALVTSYSDRVRAKRISTEFLRGEQSLKKTEKLLRDLTPATEAPEQYLARIRNLLVNGGINEQALSQMISGLEKKKEPKPPRKPRKRAPAAVADGIQKRLKDLALEPERLQAIVDDLSAFVELRARERGGEFAGQVDQLKVGISRRDVALDNLPWGVILWDPEGSPEFVNRAAREFLGSEDGIQRPSQLQRPPGGAVATAPGGEATAPDVSRFLQSIVHVLAEGSDYVYGAIFSAGDANDARPQA